MIAVLGKRMNGFGVPLLACPAVPGCHCWLVQQCRTAAPRHTAGQASSGTPGANHHSIPQLRGEAGGGVRCRRSTQDAFGHHGRPAARQPARAGGMDRNSCLDKHLSRLCVLCFAWPPPLGTRLAPRPDHGPHFPRSRDPTAGINPAARFQPLVPPSPSPCPPV